MEQKEKTIQWHPAFLAGIQIELGDEYQKHGKNVLYQSMMDVIVRANTQQFSKEDKKMCEALRELMEEEFEAERGKARVEGRTEGRIDPSDYRPYPFRHLHDFRRHHAHQ